MLDRPLGYQIKTFGCQMNYSDSERVAGYLEGIGYKEAEKLEDTDIVIFNTCSIKQKAEDKALGFMNVMRSQKRKNPNFLVVLTGCMVKKTSNRLSEKRDFLLHKVKPLDIALRIEDLQDLGALISQIKPDIPLKNLQEEKLEDYFKVGPKYTSKAQAFVPVSTGCDNFCSYCIVPYSRGREKSRPIQDILDECTKLVEGGCKEITLLGQTVNSYGKSINDKLTKKFADLPKEVDPFALLLTEIDKLKEKGLKRLRFTSPHPKDFTDQLIETMGKLETIMPYIHLPLQSGNDRILKKMNRTYNIEKFMDVVNKLKKSIPDIAISTDIIVGFCSETEEEFMDTCKILSEISFEQAYISQYSQRIGTFADRHLEDDIPPETKLKRWHHLNDILRIMSAEKHKNFIGKKVKVLVERQNGTMAQGRDETFKVVEFESEKNVIGEIIEVEIISAAKWSLHGKVKKA